ncbi:Topless-related protein 2 [Zea mays]|uniref:Topless-related protein 2 n=1 Tax=Zea mays TaxID=4577 RepID=A0A1D6QKL4_MAIZE|nr:Topless-related protein 2 [Zea mays]
MLPVTYPQSQNYQQDDFHKTVARTLSQGSTPMSMDFHPLQQTLLNVGTNVGDIGSWDVGTKDRLVVRNFKVWDLSKCTIILQVLLIQGILYKFIPIMVATILDNTWRPLAPCSHHYCKILSVRPVAAPYSATINFRLEGFNLLNTSSRVICSFEGRCILQEDMDSVAENAEYKDRDIESLSLCCYDEMEEVDEHEGQHGIISRKQLKEMSIMLHVKEAKSPIMLSVKFKERLWKLS